MRIIRLVATTLIVQTFGLCISVSPISAQTSQQLLNRIHDGDYVWSLRFSREEARLIGYGYAVLNSVRETCPNVISGSEFAEVEGFVPTLTGGNVNLRETIQGFPIAGAYQALETSAKEDVEKIVGEPATCTGDQIHRIGQNVWRMLAGRRPVVRRDMAGGGTFLDEEVVPISAYHRYAGEGASLAFGSAADVFESDVGQLREWGVTILECRYDEDPNDQSHEEQYYWGPSFVADMAYRVNFLWGTFILSSQARMDRATGTAGRGSGRVIHPFATYGSPRRECPSLRDPDLSIKRIAVREAFSFPTGRCRPVGNGLFKCPG